MELEAILFILRLASGLFLLAILVATFFFIWRDFRATAHQADLTRRSYGHLVALVKTDNGYVPNGNRYGIRPLTSMGRAITNTIVMDDNFVSNEHALLALRNNQWWLEDRKSRNGTILNGENVTTSVIITDGDIISIGKYNFRVELE